MTDPAPAKEPAMAIPTSFELTFGCGHVGMVDLSALPPDRRPGRLNYLTGRGLCDDCLAAAARRRRRPTDDTGRAVARPGRAAGRLCGNPA